MPPSPQLLTPWPTPTEPLSGSSASRVPPGRGCRTLTLQACPSSRAALSASSGLSITLPVCPEKSMATREFSETLRCRGARVLNTGTAGAPGARHEAVPGAGKGREHPSRLPEVRVGTQGQTGGPSAHMGLVSPRTKKRPLLWAGECRDTGLRWREGTEVPGRDMGHEDAAAGARVCLHLWEGGVSREPGDSPLSSTSEGPRGMGAKGRGQPSGRPCRSCPPARWAEQPPKRPGLRGGTGMAAAPGTRGAGDGLASLGPQA